MKCNSRQSFSWRIAFFFLLFSVPMVRAATLVQDFYLPMPEQQIYQANSAIISGTGSTIASTFSIIVTGNGTVIYYDQWEDGYETDLSNPTQPTTQIWGDGNDADGIPPGFAHNPLGLAAGTVITLTNNVTLPRNPSTILWDARDHIAATKAVIISRAAWPIPTGPVFAGAVSVLSTMDYGTNYISPVGQNLTNINLMKYVGMFIMAAQDNTAVTIDPNGNGVGTTNIVLNQGESYLVNGGIMVGGRVTASEPIQADLIIGHVGASYASDWFTLYPASAWSSSYFTPVGSAATVNEPAYVYLYNPGSNAITINYNTKVSSGSFSVPGTNGVYQFQMPVSSGASFVSTNGQNFYALCTVAANNSADTAWNWGFTLVPQAALTTVADVGWAPGSADGTVDGSPVWVTTLGNTTVYVDYHGDTNGPLTDPNGNKYDTNFSVSALQSLKIYDPSKNQTGMKVYTVDGTLLTAAWGEDPDVAGPGNPYIDAGTTVLPFPVPVVKKSAVIVTNTGPPGLSVGDTIRYTVEVDNEGLLPLGNTVVVDAPSTNLLYLTNSTTYNGTPIPDSATGTAFPLDAPGYTIPVILSQGTSTFSYLCLVTGGGVVSNSANIAGTSIFAAAALAPAPTNGASVSLNFTDTNGVPVSLYAVGANVYVTMTNAVANTSSNSAQSISVTVVDLTHGDLQTITLTETGTNTGVFRNITGLPTSATAGLEPQDGILNVTPGDVLSVNYTDPNYGDSATNTAGILIPALTKQLYLSVNGSTNGVQDLNRIDPVAYGHSPTRTSADIGSGGSSGLITVDNTTFTNSTANTTVLNVQHTTSSGANYMLVTVAIFTYTADDPVLSVFYTNTVGKSAQTLTRLTSILSGTSAQGSRTEIWGLSNPSATNSYININLTSSRGCNAGVTTFFGLNTGNPTGNAVSNSATSGTDSTVNITTTSGQYVVAVAATVGSPSPAPNLLSNGNGQISLWTTNATGGDNGTTSCTISNAVKSGTTTMSATWSATTPGWAICAVALNPAAASGSGPATNVATFVQTPVFSSAFTMPSNNVITITNFITITNGTIAAGSVPGVTATLQYGGTSFLTLANPTYFTNNSFLVWSGVLSSNVTVPAGQTISYAISNGLSGVAFHVNYDSTNMPSKIILPASTVININTLGVYDGPYPGGNLVTTPVAGSTFYVRANVSDPFGNYDITSLGLAIVAPSPSANVNVTLTNANVVATNSTSETYEYAWQTSLPAGGYNITATANEGTEGVTNSAGTSVSLIFLDLGTPSATVFTSGNNGPATNGFPANSSACVRVTALDSITNAATVQTIAVTLTSSAGDTEILTLTETSTNTGVYTACINTSTNTGTAPYDGTLYAPVGSIITASYTDPNDSSYDSSATATIQPLPGVPGVAMNKTIVSPSGGQVGTGQPVTYNLQVVNTGSTLLTNVIVTDNFPSNQLSYSGASLAPTSTNTAGILTWTNIGAMSPGQSTNLTVTFITLTTGMATNSATANGGTAVNSSSVTLLVTHAALNIKKILLSPTNTPVAVGSNVVFRITIQNTGNTVIPILPLEDYFSGAYFQFVSATVPPNGSGAGSLIWTNLASPVALGTNATITNDITMTVVGQGNPANNTATADFAVDSFGNPVPTASGSVGVVTAAAGISGHVFDDLNQNGVFTNGDTGLSDVTLSLYTDPNGDGNPADGTLVQIVTTDANGFYNFLNLNLGHYVAVATPLPGYASSVPANNRLAFNLTTLTTSTNNNFFQYIPSPSLYSTINGTVWNDVNGNGTNDAGETGIANVGINLVQDVNSNGIADPGEPVVASVLTDVNGNYSLAGVTPGHYVIQQTLLYGYYSTGDSQGRTDSQISFVSTNGIVSTNNNFFDRLSPIAVNDTNSTLNFVPVTIYPLTNDISPNGDALTITNATTTNGILVINPGSTNLTFTPTNTGADTITYTAADQHGGTSSAVIIVNVTALADLAVGKTALASVFAASNLTYTISVTNFGPSPASLVVVTDALPAGVTFAGVSGGGANNSGMVSWSLGTLISGQVSNLTVTVTAPATGTITNTASVSSPTPDPTATNNVTPPVTTSITPLADLGLGKTASAFAAAASSLTYTISVTNFGPSSASSVLVTDALPAGVTFAGASGGFATNDGVVTWSLGTLTNSQVTNLTLTVTTPASGTLTNTASVGSPTGDPNGTNNVTPPVTTSVTPVADVALSKTGPAGIIFGTNFNYTISVINAGPSTAAGISVTDSLPAGLVFVSSVPVTTTNASGQVIWNNFGNLAAGTATNLTLTVISTTRGTVTNIATGGSPVFDPVTTNNSTPPVVTAVTNSPPLANPDSYAVSENSTNTLTPLANDVVQTPGGSLSLISVNATNGTASISGPDVIFTPASNFVGTATIGYTITDNVGGTNSSLITVTVTNRPPVANPDSYSMAENTTNAFSPLANDVVVTPGGTLAIISVSPTNGTAAIVSGTNVQFTPTLNFTGTATIGYTITDSIGGTNSSLITISVTNRPPVANPDSYSMAENTTNVFAPLANDVLVTTGGALTILSVAPTNGTAMIIGGTNVQFVPATNFTGTATIGYTITDGVGGTNSSLITITITNRPPVANPDAYSMAENTADTFTPLENDVLVTTGGTLTILSVAPTNGSAAILGGTNVQFTPATNFVGTATIGYVITDGVGGTNSSLITISVTNRPPVANPDFYTASENISATLMPLDNDVVVTSGGRLAIIGASPTNGTASIVGGTNILFTPATNFLGMATIGYTITDGIGGTNSSLITITVTNLPVIANPVFYSMAENTTNTFAPLVNDSATTPGGYLTLVSLSPTNGTATILGGTNVQFVPTANFTGTATIGYTITDGIGGTNSSLITIAVTNRPPQANPDNYSMAENTTNTFAPLANDVLVTTGGTLAIISVSPTNGTATIIGGTNVQFTPTTNFVGTATIGYRITDNIGGTNSSLITITVTNVPLAQADIAVFKSGPTNGVAGSNLTYTVTVTNLGPAVATNILVTDELPAGFAYVSASPSPSTVHIVNPVLVNWGGISLASNTSTNFTVTAVSAEGGTFTNIALATTFGTVDTNSANSDGSSTNSQVLTTVTPLADVAVFKTGGTNVLAGGAMTYTITATNAGPSTASNVVVKDNLPAGTAFQSASGTYTTNNGVVTWSGVTLAKGAMVSYTLTLTAPAGGSFMNTALSTSDTPDPNTNNNNGSAAGSKVGTIVTPSADLIVMLSGPASAPLGSNINYSITVSNAGPSTASNVVVEDTFPVALVFSSATGGGTNANGTVTWPTLAALLNGGSTNFTLTVVATNSGVITNIAFASAATFDPDLTNNNGTLSAAQAQTVVAPVQFGITAGTNVTQIAASTYRVTTNAFNPQTGLYEESVTVTNTGTTTVAGVRLLVSGLRSGVTLYNATGTNAGTPYAEYDGPLNPTNTVPPFAVTFALEFYDPLRVPFTNTLTVVAILPPAVVLSGTNGVAVTNVFMDTRIAGDTRFVIEFSSVPGATYTIIYKDSLTATNWLVATPSITANANITQWYDDGPPKTTSQPASTVSRFYRVIQN